uniref:Right handed beta helix domain-containing protein n=1 Tax=Ananas comosus var. bracteatus TaxID=296719 RepID=A0A6V7NLR5_ANACO|nr:unnamed protein product [Ananas comosus var. bracteatus]
MQSYNKLYRNLTQPSFIHLPLLLSSFTMVAVEEYIEKLTVVVDGVEFLVEKSTFTYKQGTVKVVRPGEVRVDRFDNIQIKAKGYNISFHRCNNIYAEGGQKISVHRCSNAQIVQSSSIVVKRCNDVYVSGGGNVLLERCGVARVEGGRNLLIKRCSFVSVDFCGDVCIKRCDTARILRCGALRVHRCYSVDVWGCNNILVHRGKVNCMGNYCADQQQQQNEDECKEI